MYNIYKYKEKERMPRKPIFDDWPHGRERIRKLHRKIYKDMTENGICEICGEDNNGKKLEIHHLWLKDSDKYTGLIFVCRNCHSKFFHNPKKRKNGDFPSLQIHI